MMLSLAAYKISHCPTSGKKKKAYIFFQFDRYGMVSQEFLIYIYNKITVFLFTAYEF